LKRKNAYLDDFIWEDALNAVKESTKFSSFDQFYEYLRGSLPQNSEESRRRAAANLVRWYFPLHTMDNLLTDVWKYYGDEDLVKNLMRYLYLSNTPLVGEFITSYVLPLEAASQLKLQTVDDYVLSKRGTMSVKLRARLITTVGRLGFIHRQKGNLTVIALPLGGTAFLILIHSIFAPEQRVVSLDEILTNPFWKYLGMRREDDVRNLLRMALRKGLIAKYVIADQLEQVNTRYTLKEILNRKTYL